MIMNLKEAIKHCEDKIDTTCCGKEHEQLAKWLEELKEIKEANTETISDLHKLTKDIDQVIEDLADVAYDSGFFAGFSAAVLVAFVIVAFIGVVL